MDFVPNSVVAFVSGSVGVFNIVSLSLLLSNLKFCIQTGIKTKKFPSKNIVSPPNLSTLLLQ